MMELHVSVQSSSYDSDLPYRGTSYQQFAEWLRNHLEKLKTPTDPHSSVEILSSKLGITYAFAQLLLSGYVRPNSTLMQKLLKALPSIPAKNLNQRRWAVDNDTLGLIQIMDTKVSQENQETDDSINNQNSNVNIENGLPIKLRGLCG
jgi:hypothetical protein